MITVLKECAETTAASKSKIPLRKVELLASMSFSDTNMNIDRKQCTGWFGYKGSWAVSGTITRNKTVFEAALLHKFVVSPIMEGWSSSGVHMQAPTSTATNTLPCSRSSKWS